MDDSLRNRIHSLVNANRVVLFMKGNKTFPQCGFSAQVLGILKQAGVDFDAHNVLTDAELRQGIKEFSEWPTIPQLYVEGKFVGGCDIVTELYQRGELDGLLKGAA
jgi:monothiol glutaredoxin